MQEAHAWGRMTLAAQQLRFMIAGASVTIANVDVVSRAQSKKTVEGNHISHPAACSTPERKAVVGGGGPRLAGSNGARERRATSTSHSGGGGGGGMKTAVEQTLPRAAITAGGGGAKHEQQWKGLPSLPTASKARQPRSSALPAAKLAKDGVSQEQASLGCPRCFHSTTPAQDRRENSVPPPPPPFLPYYHHPHNLYGYPWGVPTYPCPCFSHLHNSSETGCHHVSSPPSLHQGVPPPPRTAASDGIRTTSATKKNEQRNMDALDLASLHCWPPPPRLPPLDYYWYLSHQHGFHPPHGLVSPAQPPLGPHCQPVPSQGTLSTSSEPDNEGTQGSSGFQGPHLPCFHPQSLTSASQFPKKPLLTEPSSNKVPVKAGGTSSREASSGGRVAVVPLKLDEASDMEGLESVLEDLMTGCEENLKTIRTDVRGVVGTRLAHLGEVVAQVRHHLVEQCRRVALKARQDRRNEKSATDWLAQIQEIEKEKAGLIERLKESCTAYSELRRKLDSIEEEKQTQHKKLEEARQQVSNTRAELATATASMKEVTASLRLKEKELDHIRSSTGSVQDLKAKIVTLEKHIAALSGEVDTKKDETKRLRTELKRARRALSESKEEEEVLRVSVQSKGSQLLEVQDKLLGMRQCLACFLSCLSRLRTAKQDSGTLGPSSVFLVPADELEKLKLLAEDGNVENYLATYDKRDNLKVTFPDLLDDKVEKGKKPTIISSNWDNLSSCSTSATSQDSVITPVGSLAQHSGNDHCTTPVATTPEHGLNKRDETCTNPPQHDWRTPHRDMEHSPSSLSCSSSINASGSGSNHEYQGRVQVPSLTDVRSSVTTASELDFRRELATLDADIARLQVQFRVALQPTQST